MIGVRLDRDCNDWPSSWKSSASQDINGTFSIIVGLSELVFNSDSSTSPSFLSTCEHPLLLFACERARSCVRKLRCSEESCRIPGESPAGTETAFNRARTPPSHKLSSPGFKAAFFFGR
uniref:Uncharacterized protein n=1 Tax=Hanusia phi TaxID=3032 RepID=A0A7S0EYA0_9CRYP